MKRLKKARQAHQSDSITWPVSHLASQSLAQSINFMRQAKPASIACHIELGLAYLIELGLIYTLVRRYLSQIRSADPVAILVKYALEPFRSHLVGHVI